MKNLSTEVFREMISTAKSVIRAVWGSCGIEGLTGPQFGVLMMLRRIGPLSPSELSEQMLVTQGNMTGLIARLKKNNWVERRRSSVDRRVLKIALTPTGNEKLDTVIPLWREMVEKYLSILSVAEQKTLHSLMVKLKSGLPENVGH